MSPHSDQVIEVSLIVTVPDDATAANVSEVLARNMVGLTDGVVTASLSVDRYERICHHDEVEP